MKCDTPFNVKLTKESSAKNGINTAPVPCGKCYTCKARRIQQWSFRIQKELEVSTSAYFCTLTYDPHHVPIVKGRYPMTLVKNSDQNEKLADSEGGAIGQYRRFSNVLGIMTDKTRYRMIEGQNKQKTKSPLNIMLVVNTEGQGKDRITISLSSIFHTLIALIRHGLRRWSNEE